MKQRVSACSSCVFVFRCESLSSLIGRFTNMADDVPTCQICQQALDDAADGADERVRMRCAHAFHYECIMEWAHAKGAHCTTMAELWEADVKCPICKKTGIDLRNAEVFVFSGKPLECAADDRAQSQQMFRKSLPITMTSYCVIAFSGWFAFRFLF